MAHRGSAFTFISATSCYKCLTASTADGFLNAAIQCRHGLKLHYCMQMIKCSTYIFVQYHCTLTMVSFDVLQGSPSVPGIYTRAVKAKNTWFVPTATHQTLMSICFFLCVFESYCQCLLITSTPSGLFVVVADSYFPAAHWLSMHTVHAAIWLYVWHTALCFLQWVS